MHYDAPGFPEFSLKVVDDTVEVNVKRLDRAVAWRLSAPPSEGPPNPDEVLSRWRIVVKVEDEPVALLGRGVPGVEVQAGRAAFLLFRDFVKGALADRSPLRRKRRAKEAREVLSKEIAYSRERAGATVTDDEVEAGQETLAGPRRLSEAREALREKYR